MADKSDLSSKIRGSILGVAVVDALGSPVEFHPRGTFPTVEDMLPNKNFGVPAGSWTDDTSLTLCLAQSLIDNQGQFIAQDQARRFVRWYEDGYLSSTGSCFDIGGATRVALETWDEYFRQLPSEVDKLDPEAHLEGQKWIDMALRRQDFCGNGSLMRISPIGLLYHKDLAKAKAMAEKCSALTHPYPTNSEACKLYTAMLVKILGGASKEELASVVAEEVRDLRDPNLRDRLLRYKSLDDWHATESHQIKSSGYVVSTIEAALWSFFTTSTFKEGAIRAVNLGDDADTVGAVYGGLGGAFYGEDQIPPAWLDALQKKELVMRIASESAELVQLK